MSADPQPEGVYRAAFSRLVVKHHCAGEGFVKRAILDCGHEIDEDDMPALPAVGEAIDCSDCCELCFPSRETRSYLRRLRRELTGACHP